MRAGGDWCCIRLLLLFLAISFFNAAPSKGLSSSKAQSRSSDTLITAPKLSNSVRGEEGGRGREKKSQLLPCKAALILGSDSPPQ